MRSIMERWNSISLRAKITSVTVLIVTVALLASGIGTLALLGSYLQNQVDLKVTTVAQNDLSPYFIDSDNSTVLTPDELIQNPTNDVFIALYDQAGNPIANNWMTRNPGTLPVIPSTLSPEDAASDSQITWLKSHDDTETFRSVTTTANANEKDRFSSAIVAISTEESEDILTTYLVIFLSFGFIVLIISAVLTSLLVGSTLAPLRRVERAAAAFADGDFSQRIAGQDPSTEIGQLNQSLNVMLDRIEEALAERTKTIDQMRRFVGDASHELRTPLVSLRGYAELYRMGALSTPEAVTQAMERIEKEAIRMGRLVEDLLELARLDSPKPVEFSEVDLLPLAQDAALDARAIAPDRDITVDVSSERAHPSLMIKADENKIRQVLTNVIGNALRYTPDGTPIEVRVSSEPESGSAIVDVVDHGEGIPADVRENIFQRFWRADTSRTRETGGSGLGLAIVAAIIAAHNGAADVVDTPGGGATFRITLPLAHSSPTAIKPPATAD